MTEITLRTAAANIVSARMMDELSAELEKVVGMPHKKLVILTGTGKQHGDLTDE
ncbi:MAG: hypothetical protein ACE5JU_11985 [Candidatus Binatia bacterium]